MSLDDFVEDEKRVEEPKSKRAKVRGIKFFADIFGGYLQTLTELDGYEAAEDESQNLRDLLTFLAYKVVPPPDLQKLSMSLLFSGESTTWQGIGHRLHLVPVEQAVKFLEWSPVSHLNGIEGHALLKHLTNAGCDELVFHIVVNNPSARLAASLFANTMVEKDMMQSFLFLWHDDRISKDTALAAAIYHGKIDLLTQLFGDLSFDEADADFLDSTLYDMCSHDADGKNDEEVLRFLHRRAYRPSNDVFRQAVQEGRVGLLKGLVHVCGFQPDVHLWENDIAIASVSCLMEDFPTWIADCGGKERVWEIINQHIDPSFAFVEWFMRTIT